MSLDGSQRALEIAGVLTLKLRCQAMTEIVKRKSYELKLRLARHAACGRNSDASKTAMGLAGLMARMIVNVPPSWKPVPIAPEFWELGGWSGRGSDRPGRFCRQSKNTTTNEIGTSLAAKKMSHVSKLAQPPRAGSSLTITPNVRKLL